MIRPKPARWFEILAARDDATLALEALAATGAVELEARPSAVLPAALADIRPQLSEFAELSLRYRRYWPQSQHAPRPFPESPSVTLTRSLAHLRAWSEAAEPVIAQLQRCEAERAEILLWRRVLATIGESVIDFARLAGAGPVLHARLFVFPPGSEPELPPGTLSRSIDLDGTMPCALCALTVGAADDVLALAQQAALLKGHVYDTPAWLKVDAGETERYITPRLAALDREQARLVADLDDLSRRHDLHAALGDAARLQWVIDNVRALESGEHFCWITGWTSDFSGQRLAAALEGAQARALLHFPPPAPKSKAPLLLANPRWVRPFEIFSRALGMPSRNEADPSLLLALAVPLMFGYMFGDVGQGLVIAAAGFALRNRFAIARLFIAGGIAAAGFGLLFGSVFSVHALQPLWVEPLAAPLMILGAPLAGGAVLLTLGLVLNALEAWWRERIRDVGGHRRRIRRRVPRHPRRLRRSARIRRRRHRRRGVLPRARAPRAAHDGGAHGDRRTRRAPAADPHQHAFVRPRRRIRARARRALVGHRRADGRQRQRHRQGARAHRRQRDRPGAGDDGRLDPDDASRAFRILHPLPDGRGPDLPPAAGTSIHRPGEALMKSPHRFIGALVALTAVLAVAMTALLVLTPGAAAADAVSAASALVPEAWSLGLIGAALATGLSSLGAGFAVAKVGTAAIGALAEKPELFGRLLIFVGLAEGIAIYGLIVSILILNRLV